MLWLSRPPYLRWIGAGVIAVLALYGRLSPTPTELRPFATRAIGPGETVADGDVEWRPVPVHLLPEVELPAVSAAPIAAGEPILASRLGAPASAPEGWWAAEVPVPSGVVPGAAVRLVAAAADGGAPSVIPGVVVEISSSAGTFDGRPRALVAVPPDGVAAVASAAAEQRLTVVVAASDLAGRMAPIGGG